jgi:5-hydroxyisourate hydrolase-like protein (transthyretin family)
MTSRLTRAAAILAVIAVAFLLSTCGESGPPQKEVFPVKGQVAVDGGQPGSPIRIECHDVNGIDKEMPTISWCQTANDGTFSLSTYKDGDGVPAGEYSLTFQWGDLNLVSMSYSGDRFKKKYADPKSSTVRFKVGKGTPISLDVIQLTTKNDG